jgi:hypothetical protein
MAWTTPKTWSTNEVVTAANANTHWRDNLSFLGSPPSCAVSHSTSPLVSDSTFTVMSADTELFDTDTMHSTVSNTSRITATTAGRYELKVTMRFGINGAGSRIIAYRINGGSNIQIASYPNAGAQETVISGWDTVVLAATDYVEALAWQNVGGNLNVNLQRFSLTLVTVV